MDNAEFTLPFEFRIYKDSSLAYMVDVCDGGRASFVDNIINGNYDEYKALTICGPDGCQVSDKLYEILMEEYKEEIVEEIHKAWDYYRQ